jgi:hypothetical protein
MALVHAVGDKLDRRRRLIGIGDVLLHAGCGRSRQVVPMRGRR